MKEEWKDVVGYEGFYQVSCIGRVRSMDKKIGNKTYKGRMLKVINTKRYNVVCLCSNGVQKQKLVHTLVAEAFIPNPENKPYVDHIDTNMTNNRVDNLRWVTPKENSNNPLTLKHQSLSQKGLVKKHWPCSEQAKKNIALAKSRPVKCCDLKGNEVAQFDLLKDAAKFAEISIFAIYHNLQGQTKTAGGYRWSLVNNI